MNEKKKFSTTRILLDYVIISCTYDFYEKDQTHKIREWRDFFTRLIPTMTWEAEGETLPTYIMVKEFREKAKIPAPSPGLRPRMWDDGMGGMYKYLAPSSYLEREIPGL